MTIPRRLPVFHLDRCLRLPRASLGWTRIYPGKELIDAGVRCLLELILSRRIRFRWLFINRFILSWCICIWTYYTGFIRWNILECIRSLHNRSKFSNVAIKSLWRLSRNGVVALFTFSLCVPNMQQYEIRSKSQELFQKSSREAYRFTLTISFKLRDATWLFSPDVQTR